MNDTITLIDPNEPCKHGYNIGKCPVDEPVWCPGGRERRFRKVFAAAGLAYQWVWVEVDDDV